VTLPDGEVRSGRDLSGIHGLLFRRNSMTGAVEGVPNAGVKWEGLNVALHAN
jgi:2,3,4,5-tetrahydropyridine-2-carboxylate N-succinyltransferase